MKKIIFITVLGLCSTLSAMQKNEIEIKLPSAEILKRRLETIGLQHFLKETQLHKELGNQEIYPLGVVNAVDFALYDYNKKNPKFAAQMEMFKPIILKKLLQDHPDAIDNLKANGLME